ncbi:hypothetical protein CFP66_37205 [Pseudonocardia sp. MH-G8]|nr:hypothetical protein CFP66_37205 [Pseudonocardia sp. MH-G8]
MLVAGTGAFPGADVAVRSSHIVATPALSMVAVSSPAEFCSRRRRARADATRTSQLVVRFAPSELAVVAAAAERDGLAVGAWIGELACRVARGEVGEVPVEWVDVVRVLLRYGREAPATRARLDELVDVAVARLSL